MEFTILPQNQYAWSEVLRALEEGPNSCGPADGLLPIIGSGTLTPEQVNIVKPLLRGITGTAAFHAARLYNGILVWEARQKATIREPDINSVDAYAKTLILGAFRVHDSDPLFLDPIADGPALQARIALERLMDEQHHLRRVAAAIDRQMFPEVFRESGRTTAPLSYQTVLETLDREPLHGLTREGLKDLSDKQLRQYVGSFLKLRFREDSVPNLWDPTLSIDDNVNPMSRETLESLYLLNKATERTWSLQFLRSNSLLFSAYVTHQEVMNCAGNCSPSTIEFMEEVLRGGIPIQPFFVEGHVLPRVTLPGWNGEPVSFGIETTGSGLRWSSLTDYAFSAYLYQQGNRPSHMWEHLLNRAQTVPQHSGPSLFSAPIFEEAVRYLRLFPDLHTLLVHTAQHFFDQQELGLAHAAIHDAQQVTPHHTGVQKVAWNIRLASLHLSRLVSSGNDPDEGGNPPPTSGNGTPPPPPTGGSLSSASSTTPLPLEIGNGVEVL
ncbi:MAG: hypothetical protein Q7S00_00795, partial [bacterium]|nr:hypothetical protein [bacterium]